ncbi:hypothetical protein ACH5RR_039881 [Cinchona calisaya]|uniref:PHD finger protein ALFIN-LIKE n=1 Tax=Cinchona calisaya TaxID=153742 RepID=A0ABD2XZY5_9GENT
MRLLKRRMMPRVYKCAESNCSKGCKSPNELELHYINEHPEVMKIKLHVCRCKARFGSREELLDHQKQECPMKGMKSHDSVMEHYKIKSQQQSNGAEQSKETGEEGVDAEEEREEDDEGGEEMTELDEENLCLCGLPDLQWEVSLPVEEVPPELPEPALGINFACDGMQEKDWLSLVAEHSDAWLLAFAFYFGARFGFDNADRNFEPDYAAWFFLLLEPGASNQNRKLHFNMINGLPTVFEVVTGSAKKQSKEKSSVSNHSSNKSKANSTVPERGPDSQGNYSRGVPKDEEEEDGLDKQEDEDHGDTLCGACGKNYGADEFWIFCNICEKWFHGKCADQRCYG